MSRDTFLVSRDTKCVAEVPGAQNVREQLDLEGEVFLMAVSNFNAGWTVQEKKSPFEQHSSVAPPREITLPHDALILEERSADASARGKNGYFPSKAYTYSKNLNTEEYDDASVFILEFDGVYRSAMVYVNGCLVGQQTYGYSRFFVDVTPYLVTGTTNEIKVECRAHLDSRWYTGAGIYRDVKMHALKSLGISPASVKISTIAIDEDVAQLNVEGLVRSSRLAVKSSNLAIVLRNEAGETVAHRKLPVTATPLEETPFWATFELECPKLWTPDTPYLYRASIELTDGSAESAEKLDQVEVKFGVRTIQTRANRGLLLNGNAIKLRGACVHHDNGPLGAVSHFDAEVRRISKLKDAGFNAIRSSHNPMSEAMLDACDVVGMLVIEEAFDVWTQSKTDYDYSLSFATDWESDIESMVGRAFNHPSVIMYSIGNEILEIGNPSGAILSRKLVQKLKSLDARRPVTNGINGFVAALDLLGAMRAASENVTGEPAKKSVNEAMSAGDMMNMISASPMVSQRIEEASSVLDVVGLNYGDSRYLLPNESGAQPLVLGSETFPPRIGDNWPVIETHSNLVGDFTWTGWDYLGEVGIGRVRWADESQDFEAPFPWLSASVGDFDISGVRRPISYYREAVFGISRKPYIAVQNPKNFGRTALAGQWAWHDCHASWTWSGCEGQPAHVEVYTTAQRIEVFLNERLVFAGPSHQQDAPRVAFEVEYQPGTLRVDAFDEDGLVSTSTLETAGAATSFVALLETPRNPLQVGSLAFFELQALDSRSMVCPANSTVVEVQEIRGGELLALANGDPKFQGTFHSSRIPLFEGKALAIVRVNDPTQVQLSVSEV